MDNKITIQNAQFTLYYLLMAVDGSVSEEEKNIFIEIVNEYGEFTKSYCSSLFNAMHKFSKTLNYKNAIDDVNLAPLCEKVKTIELLRKLSFADKTYGKEEVDFILKVKKDLGLE